MLLNIVVLIVSLLVVVKAADYFLKYVEIIGKRFNLSPFILGVLLVGFGTSLPELATSISSVMGDTHNVTIANIIGSNMANILLILGISTFFLGTIRFKKDLINLDLPHLFCVSLLFGILIIDGSLNFYDGLMLITGFVIYVLYNLSQKTPEGHNKSFFAATKSIFIRNPAKAGSKKARPAGEGKISMVVILLIASIAALALGSRFAVVNMLSIAERIDLAVEVVTFVTIALGTSLPELLVTFKALKRKQGDLVLGNIIGSSVFNILLVGGFVSLIHPQVIDASILPWSIAGLIIAASVIVLNAITKEIHAWEGAVFILIYIAIISKIVA